MAELRVKVPIRFSEKAQKDLYETCVGYKKHAEMRGADNEKLRELVRDMYACISHANEADWFYFERDKPGCGMSCTINGEACGLRALADRMRELGVEVDDGNH